MEAAAVKLDKPEQWFKTPFASVYMVSAESPEQYKSVVRPKLQAWVDALEPQSRVRGSWIILFVGIAPQQSSRCVLTQVYRFCCSRSQCRIALLSVYACMSQGYG